MTTIFFLEIWDSENSMQIRTGYEARKEIRKDRRKKIVKKKQKQVNVFVLKK